MQENHLFEYAVIRIVPRVEREEFLNVGVILYCQKLKFLHTRYKLDRERIKAFGEEVDCKELEEQLQAFERISLGTPGSGPIGQLDLASRFRWLTANRSTILQTSRVHPGFCENPKETLEKLFDQLVIV